MRTPLPPRRFLPLLAMFLFVTACAVPNSRYLSLKPTNLAIGSKPEPEMAVVLIRPFSEAFTADAPIGRHLFSKNRQTKLLVKPGQVSLALDAILQQELVAKKIAVAQDGSTWDQSPAGLAAFKNPNQLLISGRISHLSLNVDETLFSTKAQAEMDVECILGVIKDKKVIHRRVHVAQEMITLSFGQQELDKLLRNCLTAASQEILAHCSDLMAFLAPEPLQKLKNTEPNEQNLSLSNEHISQTNRGRYPYRTSPTTTGAVSLQGSPA